MGAETKEIVASNIYYYRKRAKITQEELAGRANAGQKTVSKIENGRQNYSIDTLERLCIELKIPMYRVFTPRDGIGFRELLSDPAYAKGVIMLLYHYYMFMSTLECEEPSIGKYDTYGIALEDYEDVSIEDISTNKNFVKHLVEFCNEYQVSPVHFLDVVEDAMLEYEDSLE